MPEALFIQAADGQRFAIHHAPEGAFERGIVLYLHPFAEEMNKSRRMAALQSRMLAAAGYRVLQIDLHGCGDSDGDFGDATWDGWKADARLGVEWLRERSSAPLTLWGTRAGCLIAAAVAAELPEPPDLFFWHPVLSGKQYWQQFMRLKAAGELASGRSKEIVNEIRQELESGRPVEIAGYRVSPELVKGLAAAELFPPAFKARSVVWFELSSQAGAKPAYASTVQIASLKERQIEVHHSIVTGPAFWQTSEIELSPELLDATTAAMKV